MNHNVISPEDLRKIIVDAYLLGVSDGLGKKTYNFEKGQEFETHIDGKLSVIMSGSSKYRIK